MCEEKCSFYGIYEKQISSNEINYGGQRTTILENKIPYCSHMDAPQELSKEFLTTIIGGATVLRCGGDNDRCQIVENMIANHSL
jgi:hypothetical protein